MLLFLKMLETTHPTSFSQEASEVWGVYMVCGVGEAAEGRFLVLCVITCAHSTQGTSSPRYGFRSSSSADHC